MKIKAVYFSPAGATKEIAHSMAEALGNELNLPYELFSYTYPKEREDGFHFDKEDLVLWASPIYAGRIPNKTLEFVKKAIHGNGSLAIPVVCYGNRSFDNGLSELKALLEEGGCTVVGAAAISCRHSFSKVLGAGRPDEKDYLAISQFCRDIAKKVASKDVHAFAVPGEAHPEKYYVPKKENGEPAKFLKAVPQLRAESCISCGACKDVCPMGSIAYDKQPSFEGVCIKCQACIRSCQKEAIYMSDEDFLSHVKMIEENFMDRKEAQFFL